MNKIRFALPLLAITSLLPGCAMQRPAPEASQTVIQSLLPHTPGKPWRLGVSWLSGGPSGAAIRSSGFEHVVRKKMPETPLQVASLQPVEITPLTSGYTDEEIERAWRKFCRNRLGMTERDHRIIRDTSVPGWLIGNCHTANLMK
ncbi:hypothetical protein EVC37_18900 [Methylocaldum sp. BRCS4]|jgi:hypothetical protein|uniref:hypothetical protein n=1 Tax=Methylocaldum sp. 14B TaxID=1912213 RepID=UPI000989B255|nr:hypothetical protein [Methylocaldum sp. 14B]MVF23664.1 hypothetical protein [Methylocaldum sp. BRCS4]